MAICGNVTSHKIKIREVVQTLFDRRDRVTLASDLNQSLANIEGGPTIDHRLQDLHDKLASNE
jgi:hypothetical protein